MQTLKECADWEEGADLRNNRYCNFQDIRPLEFVLYHNFCFARTHFRDPSLLRSKGCEKYKNKNLETPYLSFIFSVGCCYYYYFSAGSQGVRSLAL